MPDKPFRVGDEVVVTGRPYERGVVHTTVSKVGIRYVYLDGLSYTRFHLSGREDSLYGAPGHVEHVADYQARKHRERVAEALAEQGIKLTDDYRHRNDTEAMEMLLAFVVGQES